MSEQLPSVDDLLESKLPSVDEFIKEEDLPSVDEFIGEEPPRPEEEIADNYSSRHESSPEFEKTAEEVVTMHEKMYRMATKNGGSWLGGSENCHGGSEQAWFDGEQEFTPENDPYGGY